MGIRENNHKQNIVSELDSIRQRLSDLEQSEIEIPLIGQVTTDSIPQDT